MRILLTTDTHGEIDALNRLAESCSADAVIHAGEGEKRILVRHVSPGKEAFITHMGIHCSSDLTVSGHMGPPKQMRGFVRGIDTSVKREGDRA